MKNLIGFKPFIECSNDMHNVCRTTEEYNPDKKWEIWLLIWLVTKIKLNPIVNELFVRGEN